MKFIKYRIVRDKYAGFEVQKKHLLFPFWLQAGINTFPCERMAKEYIEKLKSKKEVVYIDK